MLTCVSRCRGEMYSGRWMDVLDDGSVLSFSVSSCQTHLSWLSRYAFHQSQLHKSCDDLSFQHFVRSFLSAVSFSKPKWICSLQINFLNLMACQCQWAFKGWFLNVCVLIWRWLLSLWWRRARAEEIWSEWKQKKTKANEMKVAEYKTQSVL